MAEMTKGFVIAGPASGVGKTTITLALMAALRRPGLVVQPYKCGPDFIDAGHHTRACGRPCRNLDGWMLSPEVNREIFARHATGADVAIVEGVMGLFDGASGKSETGSTAEMAKLLSLPVVLVVDASAAARSVAALVHGFETFDSQLRVGGVVFNKVAGQAHYDLLREAVEGACEAAPLGYLPVDKRIHIPERYLGLFTADEDLLPETSFSLLADMVEDHIDLEKLLACAASVGVSTKSAPSAPIASRVRVGVARDRVFCFYYEDNLDALRAAGAEIVEFSPLNDSELPAGADALYFGGGYPELYARQLNGNERMVAAIRKFAGNEGVIYAECGGLMYLANDIITREGEVFPMCGVLPLSVQMTDRLVNFGYVEVTLVQDCLLGRAGISARGHSFHCSKIVESRQMENCYRVGYTLSNREEAEGFRNKDVLASYIHLHFLSNPGLAGAFADDIRRMKENRLAKEAKPC